jgi:hypothetical protein
MPFPANETFVTLSRRREKPAAYASAGYSRLERIASNSCFSPAESGGEESRRRRRAPASK